MLHQHAKREKGLKQVQQGSTGRKTSACGAVNTRQHREAGRRDSALPEGAACAGSASKTQALLTADTTACSHMCQWQARLQSCAVSFRQLGAKQPGNRADHWKLKLGYAVAFSQDASTMPWCNMSSNADHTVEH